ncbi:MAG: DNA gyrase inhibitor YacG [Betaproteobacteria bacterium]|nr:DNA gyrase inhibitor YacG [Betaproteobacteria bacterium]
MEPVTPKPARTVSCPHCGRPALFAPSNRFRPFCSERCRLIDLGQWATESYRVPEKPDPDSTPSS